MMEEVNRLIGRRVNYFRRSGKLTQAQLAEKANLSLNYISQIETGVATPTIKTLLAIAQALDIEIKELFDFRLPAQNYDTSSENRKRNNKC